MFCVNERLLVRREITVIEGSIHTGKLSKNGLSVMISTGPSDCLEYAAWPQ